MSFPKFSTPVSGTLREFIDNYTTTRDKIFFSELEVTNVKSGGVSMILKTGIEGAHYYNVFDYVLPIQQKSIKSQGRKILLGPGVNLAPTFFYRGTKKKVRKETPQMR